MQRTMAIHDWDGTHDITILMKVQYAFSRRFVEWPWIELVVGRKSESGNVEVVKAMNRVQPHFGKPPRCCYETSCPSSIILHCYSHGISEHWRIIKRTANSPVQQRNPSIVQRTPRLDHCCPLVAPSTKSSASAPLTTSILLVLFVYVTP